MTIGSRLESDSSDIMRRYAEVHTWRNAALGRRRAILEAERRGSMGWRVPSVTDADARARLSGFFGAVFGKPTQEITQIPQELVDYLSGVSSYEHRFLPWMSAVDRTMFGKPAQRIDVDLPHGGAIIGFVQATASDDAYTGEFFQTSRDGAIIAGLGGNHNLSLHDLASIASNPLAVSPFA